MKLNIEVKPKEWLYLAVAFAVIFLLLNGKIQEALRLAYALITRL